MRYKNAFIFISLIICLFSIASVCASDINETIIAEDNESSDELMSFSENEFCDNNLSIQEDDSSSDEKLEANNPKSWYVDASVMKDGDGSENSPFKYLNRALQSIRANDMVYMKAGEYSNNQYIDVSYNNVTFQKLGEGSVKINSPSYSFRISGENGCVDGLTFIGKGIEAEKFITVKNSIFNKTSGYNSGGIAAYKGATIINCTFMGASSQRGSGALGIWGKCEVFNSTFKDNYAQGSASDGATHIFAYGNNTLIRNCSFINGFALNTLYSIKADCNATIENCSFKSNKYGISVGDNVIFRSCEFINNNGTQIKSGSNTLVEYCAFSSPNYESTFLSSSGNNNTARNNWWGMPTRGHVYHFNVINDAVLKVEYCQPNINVRLVWSSKNDLSDIYKIPSRNICLSSENLTLTKSEGKLENGLFTTSTLTEIPGEYIVHSIVDLYELDSSIIIKQTPSFELSVNNVTYGNNSIFTINNIHLGGGNLTIYLNNHLIDIISTNDLDKVDLGLLDVNDYNLMITYSGDKNYLNLTKSYEFHVLPAQPVVNVVFSNNSYPTSTVINVSSNVGGNVTVKIGNVTNLTNIQKDSFYSFDFGVLNAGSYELFVEFDGGKNYNKSSLKFNFTIFKAEINFDINISNFTYGEPVIFSITSSCDSDIKVKIDDTFKLISIKANEAVSVDFGVLPANDYNVTIEYDGDENHEKVIISKMFSVEKISIPSALVRFNDAVFGGENKQIVLDLPRDATGNLTLFINNKNYTVNVQNAHKIELPNLNKGIYEFNITYSGDEKYSSFKTNGSIVIKDMVDIFDICSNNTSISVNLPSDAQGNITILINQNNYTFNVTNGNSDIKLPELANGIYNYTLIYSGDEKYDRVKTNSTLVVKKIIPTIVSHDLCVNYTSLIEFDAAFFNEDGSPLKNEYVIFKVNEDEHAIKTDSNGFAILKIQLNPGMYNITLVNVITNETKNNTLIVRAAEQQPIDEKDIHIPSLNGAVGGTVVVKLPDDASGTITLEINGKNYYFSVVNGVANIKVPDLANGEYAYTIVYSGDNKYASFTKTDKLVVNKVSPKPATKITLKLKKVKVKRSAKKLVLQATLKIDGKSKKGLKVKFKFNKKTYTAKTNKNGVAKVTIKKKVLKKLKVGKKVKYAASYGKIVVKKTVKVKR